MGTRRNLDSSDLLVCGARLLLLTDAELMDLVVVVVATDVDGTTTIVPDAAFETEEIAPAAAAVGGWVFTILGFFETIRRLSAIAVMLLVLIARRFDDDDDDDVFVSVVAEFESLFGIDTAIESLLLFFEDTCCCCGA